MYVNIVHDSSKVECCWSCVSPITAAAAAL